MCRSLRIVILLLLVSVWTAGLFTTPYAAKAQSEEPSIPFLGHIVQPGEDLETIAARYQTTAEALAHENQLSVSVPLVPGQLLRIRSLGAEPLAPGVNPAVPQAEPQWGEGLTGEKWIDIDLTAQTLTAYQGDTAVRSFVISSGSTGHETVTGSFRIWAKVARQDMSGGSRAAGNYYYVPNVPWVQYFYADYSIHGADWHNSFGWAVSHGCVNMRVDEARWLFEWAEPSMDPAMVESATWLFPGGDGTRVEVHD
ncbi:MAG: L,D-transpeptidase family protein [Caldilineaceae bacterium]|nr:L,D-transpeptidase family protein [Caldilineaceae bacterium]